MQRETPHSDAWREKDRESYGENSTGSGENSTGSRQNSTGSYSCLLQTQQRRRYMQHFYDCPSVAIVAWPAYKGGSHIRYARHTKQLVLRLEGSSRICHKQIIPVRLKLTTMTSPSSYVETDAVSGLTIRGMASNKQIKIPTAYTQSCIPFETAQIPTAESAQRWPHLKHLSEEMAALQRCGVGLLLGYDCPQALIPRSGKRWRTLCSENRPWLEYSRGHRPLRHYRIWSQSPP